PLSLHDALPISRTGGRGGITADAFNAVSANDNRLISPRLGRTSIDQRARFDHCDLRARGSRCEQENDRKFSHRVRIHSPPWRICESFSSSRAKRGTLVPPRG